MSEGALVLLPPETVLREPVHLVFVSTGKAEPVVTHPRNLIVAGRHSRLSLLETLLRQGGQLPDGFVRRAARGQKRD